MRIVCFWGGILWLAISCLSCTGSRSQAKRDSDLQRLKTLMTGTFDSRAQANRDSSYYPIVLHMYPIWEARGAWLYVEQALESTPDQPYRQRIYHLEQVAAGRLRSVVYTLPNAETYVGAWRTPDAFSALSPLELSVRSGCDVYLDKVDKNTFAGSTRDRNCGSDLRGATYATSEVSVYKNRIVSWDRGFDANGQQVWGAEAGGYVFRRR